MSSADENVQDKVGAMIDDGGTGTQSGITVEYQDGTADVDFTVTSSPTAGYADSAGKARQDSAGNEIWLTYLKLSGGIMTGSLNMGDQDITNAQEAHLDSIWADTIDVPSPKKAGSGGIYGERIWSESLMVKAVVYADTNTGNTGRYELYDTVAIMYMLEVDSERVDDLTGYGHRIVGRALEVDTTTATALRAWQLGGRITPMAGTAGDTIESSGDSIIVKDHFAVTGDLNVGTGTGQVIADSIFGTIVGRFDSLSVGDTGAAGEQYHFPRADGSVDQILKNDGSGGLAWAADEGSAAQIGDSTRWDFRDSATIVHVNDSTGDTLVFIHGGDDAYMIINTDTGNASLYFTENEANKWEIKFDSASEDFVIRRSAQADMLSLNEADSALTVFDLIVNDSATIDALFANKIALGTPGTVDGVDVSELAADYATDSTKLDGIESGATADQTGEEIDDLVDALLNDVDAVHTRITVTYDDPNNAMDFVVDDMNDDVPEAADYSNLTGGTGITHSPTGTINHTAHTGDVTGATALTIAANAVESTMIGADEVNDLDVNFGTGTDQVSATDLPDFGTMTVTDDNILVADGGDFESVAMSGDITINNGVTAIGTGKVDSVHLLTGAVDSAELKDGAITGPKIDTSVNFSIPHLYKADSGVVDSQYATKYYIDSLTSDLGVDIYGDLQVWGAIVPIDELNRWDIDSCWAVNADTFLELPLDVLIDTDGLGDTVRWEKDSSCALHPSERYLASGYYGFRYWLIHSPIPYVDADSGRFEVPNLAVSNNGTDYQELIIGTDTLHNPLFSVSDFAGDSVFYLSDPKLNWDADGLLWCYMRVTMEDNWNRVLASYFDTTGGPHFTCTNAGGDTLWIREGSHNDHLIISPTVLTDTGRSYWLIYREPKGAVSCDQDGYLHRYKSAYPCSGFVFVDSIAVPDPPGDTLTTGAEAGLWHMDIYARKPDDWFLAGNYNYFNLGNCGSVDTNQGEAWISQSSDKGVTWSVPRFVLRNSTDGGWDSKYVYKYCIYSKDQGNSNAFEMVYSAKDSSNQYWHTGRTTIYLEDTLALDSTNVSDSGLSMNDINWEGGIDSTRITDSGLSEDDMNWTWEYIPFTTVYGRGPGVTDSIELQQPRWSAGIVLAHDSTNQGSDVDSFWIGGTIPFAADTCDTIAFCYKGDGGADIDSMFLWGPDRSSGVNRCDSLWADTNVALNASSWTRVAWSVSEGDINAGENFALKFRIDLTTDEDWMQIAWVQMRVRR
jgi:hypothetical protein